MSIFVIEVSVLCDTNLQMLIFSLHTTVTAMFFLNDNYDHYVSARYITKYGLINKILFHNIILLLDVLTKWKTESLISVEEIIQSAIFSFKISFKRDIHRLKRIFIVLRFNNVT
ncbi:LOW QUALITY PROTEIN: hypothetical protein V1478_013698 [Vespula squamosa]|uniref:Uncharacterized protein n=1 Tax=Vespula squamosa TaxID=30214 RepID=A0ABD2A691_VESSQ